MPTSIYADMPIEELLAKIERDLQVAATRLLTDAPPPGRFDRLKFKGVLVGLQRAQALSAVGEALLVAARKTRKHLNVYAEQTQRAKVEDLTG